MPLIAHISPRSTGKTTNAAWTAQVLQDRDEAVFGFDADESQQWMKWDEVTDFEFPVIGAASAKAHTIIANTLPEAAWGVVDVGHVENHPHIGHSVLRIADLAIINCAATMSDAERIEDLPMKDPVKGYLDATATFRPDGNEVPAVVLLTRVPKGVRAPIDIRNMLTDIGLIVLETSIPDHQRYAQTGKGMVLSTNLDSGTRRAAHADMLDELTDKGLVKP